MHRRATTAEYQEPFSFGQMPLHARDTSALDDAMAGDSVQPWEVDEPDVQEMNDSPTNRRLQRVDGSEREHRYGQGAAGALRPFPAADHQLLFISQLFHPSQHRSQEKDIEQALINHAQHEIHEF